MNRREAIQKVALLLGGTLSAPTLLAFERHDASGIFSPISASNFQLTDVQKQIVAEVAEIIIPRTDTAGAKDAGVPSFIEMMMKDCYEKPEHLSFMEGVAALEKIQFLGMNATERIESIKKLEADTKKQMKARQVKKTKMGDNDDKEVIEAAAKGLPFWRLMKELTLLGYFTSEAGIKASFEYIPIPTKLEVIKIGSDQKAYAY